ncbi:LysR family transcriptional regulator [Pseudorhodobacter aquimaris]|uniref:LysR family transcriptional regulator n=1 Tax=Pseudorhodobacter aquimaris TaxID=687412 RepID=UPI00067BDC00|nr:LysR substrate-binding domain-containing protein [Pseudorhodobacter aquimaris]
MEIRLLKTFVAVAHAKGFSAAARELNTVQPAVSRQISDLEDELGVPLFWRSTREVRITAAGETLLREAIDILAHEERARKLVQRAGSGQTGRLRIGFLTAASQAFLPRLIRKFRASFPEVEVLLSEMSVREQLDALEAGRIDISFSRPLGRMTSGRFNSIGIYTDRLMGFIPEGHVLERQPHFSVSALAHHPFVLFVREGAPDLFDQVIGTCQRAGFSPEIVAQPNSMQAVLTGVGSGLGVSLAPGCIRTLNMVGCICRPLRDDVGPIPFEIHYRADQAALPTTAFAKLVTEARDEIRAMMSF